MQHIPPRGSQYILRYGLYASRIKGKLSNMPHVMGLADANTRGHHRAPEEVRNDPDNLRLFAPGDEGPQGTVQRKRDSIIRSRNRIRCRTMKLITTVSGSSTVLS